MRAGYRAGIPVQQPYTKYETDNDEVRVAYKRVNNNSPLRSTASTPSLASWFVGYKGTVLRVLIVVVLFLLGLLVGYFLRRSVNDLPSSGSATSCRPNVPGPPHYKGYNAELSRELRQHISIESLRQNLRNYTVAVHISGTSGNNRLHDYIHEQLSQLHLLVTEANYRALLSYHDWEQSNTVYLLNGSSSVTHSTEYRGPPVNGDPRSSDHPELTESYAAYSPNGTAEGELVYANYGEEKDFKLLATKGVSCKDKIVIMRYGRIFPGQMARHAEAAGAKGVLFYPDPSEVLDPAVELNDVYPSSRYLPDWATRRGSLWRFGDPLTPSMPSKDGIYRLLADNAGLIKIPVQPISYDDAYVLMSHMKGPYDGDFFGSMRGNVTYHMGPGYNPPQENWKVRIEVFNELETREITNVFGVIKGREEPDRYVIVGCHYDAWTFGGVDPNTGTAVLMELAKAFADMNENGWQPRRTIIFAHWDAGEMGQIGSYEWVEENIVTLGDRTVAYINLDEAVSGNYVVDVEASPMLRDIVTNASHKTPSSGNGSKLGSVQEMLYDIWIQRSPSDVDNFAPRFSYPSPNSDHAPFLYRLGIPVLWPRYIDHKNSAGPRRYPAYHTAIDTFEYVSRFVDPTFGAHASIAHLTADIVLQMASSLRLPFDVRELADILELEYDSLQQEGLDEFKHQLEHLQRSVRQLSEAAALFYDSFTHLDTNNELEVRLYNDRLMMLSKTFVHSSIPYTTPQIRNFLFAPSNSNSYEFSTFTGIRDTFAVHSHTHSNETHAAVERQISMAIVAVQSAYSILSEDDIFR